MWMRKNMLKSSFYLFFLLSGETRRHLKIYTRGYILNIMHIMYIWKIIIETIVILKMYNNKKTKETQKETSKIINIEKKK